MGYVYWSAVSYISDKSDQEIRTERDFLIQTYGNAGKDGLIALIGRRTDDRFFTDWGYLFTDASRSRIAGNLRTWPTALRADRGWGNFTPADGWPRTNGPPTLRAAYEMLPDGRYLLVGRTIDHLGRFRRTTAIGLATAAGLFLLLAAAAGISTSRRSVARIEAINAMSRQIVNSGLRERIPLRRTGDEWDGLAENLNSMLDRIEDLVESNRQVSDNVAHDLRTPLTRMRGRLERAYTQRLDAGRYRALIGDVIAELDDVLRTFASLLRITQIENRDPTAGFYNLDLSEIAREVVELFDPVAEENAVMLLFSANDRVEVLGDRDLLFDAMSNLVDNAIKHGGRNSEVKVTVWRAGERPVVSVADRGPGIPIDERKHVLRRFYRLERSRNSPGNGLGLSLVAAVANLHGARIEMADNLPGIRVELHFPLPRQAIAGAQPDQLPGTTPLQDRATATNDRSPSGRPHR